MRPVIPKLTITSVGTVSYKWLSLVTGGGVEYETHESFGLLRLDVEPSWEVFVNIGHDIKFDAYDTLNLSLGIGRRF